MGSSPTAPTSTRDRLAIIGRQVAATARDPRRVLRLVQPRYLRSLLFQLRPPEVGAWSPGAGGVMQRRYPSYEAYVRHQRSKLGLLEFSTYETEFREALGRRLAALPLPWATSSVLCLGARTGTEVRAFHDVGAFAVGVDLNPGRDNRYVLPGDFHHLQFPDASVDCVYSNSIDHAFDLGALITEMARVLRADGHAVIEVANPETELRADAGKWESSMWSSVDVVVDAFRERGFVVEHRAEIDFPPMFSEGGMWVFRAPGRDEATPGT